MTVFETIRRILSEQLEIDPEKITEETDIAADLGADSLDVVEMITTIEDEYGIIITDESVNEFTTVGDVTAFIEKLLG